MIDVLKRLAELDSANPQVENKLAAVESLMTVSNGSDSPVNECGGMGMMAGPSHSPASINMTANSGEELSNMLKSIVSLAGIEKGGDSHQEIELGAPQAIQQSSNDNMASTIDLITKMDDEGKADNDSLNFKKGDNAEEGWKGELAGGTAGAVGGTVAGTAVGGPVGGLVGGALGGKAGSMAGDALGDKISGSGEKDDDTPEEGMFGTAAGAGLGAALGGPIGAALGGVAGNALTGDDEENEGMYDNSPEEEIEAHDYGDKQVDPKPQGFKQRVGDNPYTPARESIESLANRLLSEFHAYVAEGKKAKPDFLDADKDGNKKEPMKKALKDKKSNKKPMIPAKSKKSSKK